MTTTSPLRVAIAGCHRMLGRTPASHNWAAAFAAVPETQLVAVFDRGAETRAQFVERWDGVAPYDDYEQMLEAARPDLVCIATRQTMHAAQIERAVRAGVRGILCDKPLATTLDELDRIVAACRGRGVPLAFGLDRRWMTSYHYLRRVVAEGAVGRVAGVVAFGLPNLINHGCHWYDAALALAGDPEIAWASGLVADVAAEPPDSRARLDPTGRAMLGLASGAVVYMTPDGGPGPSFEVLGDRGRLLILNDARDVYLWRADPGDRRPDPLYQRVLDLPPLAAGWVAGPAAVRDLVQAATHGGSTACDVEEARRATEAGFAIHTSSAAGGVRLTMAEANRTLRVDSFPWGNE